MYPVTKVANGIPKRLPIMYAGQTLNIPSIFHNETSKESAITVNINCLLRCDGWGYSLKISKI